MRVALLLLVTAGAASAQDLRYPPLPLSDRRGYEVNSWLTLRPYLRQGAYYTNNLLQQTNSRRSGDTVYFTIPGLDVHAAASDETYLEVGYAPTILVYHHEGGLDTVEHRLRYLSAAAYRRLKVRSSGTAAWAAFNADPQFTGRVRNFQGTLNLDAELKLDDGVGVKANAFANQSTNFPDALSPTNSAEWGTGTIVAISPNLRNELQILVGAGFREIHYTDHDATAPDLSLAGVTGGVKIELGDWFRIDALAGAEFPWVKRSNGLMTAIELDPEPLVNVTAAWLPVRGAELLLAVRHRLEASARAAYQRSTTVSQTISYQLRDDLALRLVATYTVQRPRRSTDLRQQSYQAILTWTPWEHVELGAQTGYTRASVLGGGFESFTVGAAVTLKL